ncbi:hypothetical protein C8Q74DRAFT_1277688 [Fomes fomentarius]|nr:hypothetical protein C8Q74DRAFT_1277688 [Fomes fomentarius]
MRLLTLALSSSNVDGFVAEYTRTTCNLRSTDVSSSDVDSTTKSRNRLVPLPCRCHLLGHHSRCIMIVLHHIRRSYAICLGETTQQVTRRCA